MKFIYYLFFFSVWHCTSQTSDINFEYSLETIPNYKNYEVNVMKNSLNDGSLTKFVSQWTSKNTLGWKDKNFIEINLKPDTTGKFEKVSFHTFQRKKSNIFFPKFALLFSTDDNIIYRLEDIIKPNEILDEGEKWFSLGTTKRSALNYKLIIIPNINYFFLDEIIFDNNKFESKLYNFEFNIEENINNVLDKAILLSNKENRKDINKFRSVSSNIPNSKTISIVQNIPFGFCFDKELNEKENCKQEDVIVSLKNNYYYKSFTISNKSNEKADVILNLKSTFDIDYVFLETQKVANSYTLDCEDALLSVDNYIHLDSLESKTLYVRLQFKETVKTGNVTFSFTNAKTNKLYTSYCNYFNIKENANEKLNIINWAYFDYVQIKNNKKVAIEDLSVHQVNSYVVPRSYLRIGNYNFEKLDNYIQDIPLNSNILLFFNFTKDDAKKIFNNDSIVFLDDLWFSKFDKWFNKLLEHLKIKGYNNIIFYPYDEVRGKDIIDFNKITNEVKKRYKNDIKTYATINNTSSLAKISNVDILQLHVNLLNKSFLTNIKDSEIWAYDIIYYGRDVSPQYYYDLALLAYQYNLKGIGFWNYSQYAKEMNYLNNYSYKKDTYSVIYNLVNGDIATSKRWEAFLYGVSQYYLHKSELF